MSETLNELEEATEVIYCYCCEDFRPHELFEGQNDNIIYQCICGCETDDFDEEIIRKEEKEE